MAETYPDSITYFPNATEGEKRVFNLLKLVLPDEDFIVWYEPKVRTKFQKVANPDFIVWGQQLGLIVLEVKDWTAKQIVDGDSVSVKIQTGTETSKRTNPERQVSDYMNLTMDNLGRCKELIHVDGDFEGRLKFPCGYGVVFTNIDRTQFQNRLSTIMSDKLAITSDEIESIEKGNKILLISRLTELRKVSFSFPALNGLELNILKGILFPRLLIPNKESIKREDELLVAEKRTEYAERIKILDKEQESVAMKIGPGHRIIMGVAGSGKTLLIAYRAKILKALHPDWKILVICYNITLRNYIKALLRELYKNADAKTDDVEVWHFHDYAFRVLKALPDWREIHRQIGYEQRDWNLFQTNLGSVLTDKISTGDIKGGIYDAILIDECQDLTTDFIRFLVHLLKSESDHLLIAFDPAQNLYGGKINWKSCNVKAQGRVVPLRKCYRNTKQILDLAYQFRPEKVEKPYDSDTETPLFPNDSTFNGDVPVVRQLNNKQDLVEFVCREITVLVNQHGFSWRDIGIIYPFKPGYLLNLTKSLVENSIPCQVITQNKLDKLNFAIDSNSCKLISIKSSKGYDFRAVFLLNVENIQENSQKKKNEVYVGITRAREKLYILYLANGKNLKYVQRIEEVLNEQTPSLDF